MRIRKRIRQRFATLLVLTLLVGIMPTGVLTVYAAAMEFAGGSGTETDPYLIETKEQLNNVRNDLDAHYKMIADIVFADSDFVEGGDFYNNGDGWQPIGNSSVPFTGYFDGNNHIITGLKAGFTTGDNSTTIVLGLFGYIKNGVLKNLGMIDGHININVVDLQKNSVSVKAGGFVGQITNATVINCYNTGNVTVAPSSSYKSVYADVGGIVGYVDSGTIIDCYNVGNISITSVTTPSSDYYNVTGSAYGGGIAGSGEGVYINCFNQGNIVIKARSAGRSASQYYSERSYGYSYAYAGGIAASGKAFTNCYNTAYIEADSNAVPSSFSFSTKSYARAGGIAGRGEDFTNCYNTGKIESHSIAYARNNTAGSPYNYAYAYSYAGGVAGEGNSFHNCYNIEDVTAPASTSASFSDFTNRPECYEYSYAGGIAGYSNENISNCYTYITPGVSKNSGSGSVAICDKEEMKNQTTYAGFDFDNTWVMSLEENHPYPKLKSSNMAGNMSLQSIEVTTKPSKLKFLEGEPLNVSGGKLTLTYDGGATIVIDITADMVSGFKSNTVGKRALTVTYGDKTTTYEIEVIAKSLVSVEVIQNGFELRTNYIEGMELDVTGGTLRLHYDNGTYDDIALRTDMVSGFDNTFIGRQELTVTYEGFSDTYSVYVSENYLAKIKLITLPNKRQYVIAREAFDASGGKLELSYANGMVEVIDLTNDMVSGFSNDTLGPVVLKVSYMDCVYQFQVAIINWEITSIELIDNGLRKEYLEGKDRLDVTGGTVRLHYNDHTHIDMALMPDMVSGFDNTAVGPQTLTVSYEGFRDTYDVEIVEKTLQSIEVTTLPVTTHYVEGKSTFSAAGGKVTLYYDNDTEETIDLTNEMVSGFSNKTVGTKTLTVSYRDKTATFDVVIDEKSLTHITVVTLPQKTVYVDGEEFDATGMVVRAYYNNGTAATLSDYTVSGYDPFPGNKTITVSFEGKAATFTVTVEEKRLSYITVTTKPNKLEYLEGDPFDATGMVVTAHYYNSDDEIITDYTISGYDSSWGTKWIKVTYQDKTTGFSVKVGGHVYTNSCDTNCNVCGAVREITHGFVWVIYIDATCGETGIKYKECTVCGEKQNKNTVIEATGKHKYTDAVTNSTCTEQGYTTFTCSVCSDSYVDSYVDATGHSYDNNCDTSCNTCNSVREVGDHKYTHKADTTCDICGSVREVIGQHLIEEGGKTYYYLNGEKTSVTDLVKINGKWYYINKGVWASIVDTLHKINGKWFLVKGGIWNKTTGLVEYKGKTFYVQGGKWDSSVNELKKLNGKWYFIKSGKWDKTLDSLHKLNSKWFLVKKGMWTATTGLVEYKGKMFYVKGGKWESRNEIVKLNGKHYFIKGGKWDKTLTTLFKKSGKYYAIKNGMWYKSKAIIKYSGKKYYVNKGYAQTSYSGKVTIGNKKYTVKKGIIK